MSDNELYYRLSGNSRKSGMVLTVCAGIGSAAAIGFIYGILVMVNPFMFLNVIGCAAIAYAIGAIVLNAMRRGHVRSKQFSLTIAIVSGFCVYYFAVVGWLMYVVEGWPIILSPSAQFSMLSQILEKGIWTLSDDVVNGWPLLIIWTVEAGALTIVPPLVVYYEVDRLVYCENCETWLNEKESYGPFISLGDEATLRAKLESGDFSIIGTLEPVSEEADDFSLMSLCTCGTCDSLHMMDIHNVTVSRNETGEAKVATVPIVNRMMLDAESYALLQEIVKDTPVSEEAEQLEEWE